MAKGRELVTTSEKVAKVKDILFERRAELAAALPRHITPDRMVRLALTACTRNPKLLECTPASFYAAILQSAQLGLEVDLLGQSYLVPYRNNKRNVVECQLIPGYLGLMDLARRSGKVQTIEARIVRKGDKFSYEYGLAPKLVHKPHIDAAGKATHAYAIARFVGGGEQWTVMTIAEIEKHRQRSRAANDGPWITDYEAMCLKTALRVLCKFLPASVELQTAVRLDEAHEAGLPQDLPVDLSGDPDGGDPAPADLPKEDLHAGGDRGPKPNGGGDVKPGTAMGFVPPADPDCACPEKAQGKHAEACPFSVSFKLE